MGLETFIKRFENHNPIKVIDGWKLINRYPFQGGCSDFALTVLFYIEGNWLKVLWAIFSFKAVFWLARSPSNKKRWPRHIILWHRDYGWIDSTVKNARDTPAPHKKILPIPFFWVYFRILWGAIWNFVARRV